MEENNTIIQAELKRLKILHASMVLGCITFLAIAFYLIRNTGGLVKNDKALLQILWYISFFLLGFVPLSYFLFKRKVDKIYPELDIYEKIVVHRGAFFIRISLLEASCFLSTAILLLTNNQIILYQVLMILIVMFLNIPYRSQMIKDMKMVEAENN